MRHALRDSQHSGFTIVELLIVIVVIGILAAITVIAYSGVQNRARIASLSSQLNGASKSLALHEVDAGRYPATLAEANNGQGIKASQDTSYQYTTSGSTYCLTATTGVTSYKVSNDATTPSAGGCAGHGVGGVAPVTNLATNPSFETSTAGWVYTSGSGYTGAITSSQAFTGANSYALTAPTTGADRYMEMSPYPAAENGTTYTISAYVYLTGTGATHVNGDVMFDAATGTRTGGAAAAYDRSKLNQWQRVSRSFTMTSAGTIRIRFNIPIGSTTYIDSVMLTSSPLSSYADGSTPSWVWNGTPNNSTSTGPPS